MCYLGNRITLCINTQGGHPWWTRESVLYKVYGGSFNNYVMCTKIFAIYTFSVKQTLHNM